MLLIIPIGVLPNGSPEYKLLVLPAAGVLEGIFDLSFRVSFENSLYTSSVIQTVPIKLLHPCKIT
jgi:hypothetical protein